MTDARVPPDRQVLYALEHLTGARFSEIAAARWLAWDRKRKPLGCLSIAYSRDLYSGRDKAVKTGVPREVPVHPRLAKILADWWERGFKEHYGRPPTLDDRIVPTRGFKARDPRNNWTRHDEDCTALEIRRTRQHDARRTFISALRNAGVPADVVNWITHGREQTVQGQYTEPAWKVLCDAVRNLPIGTGKKTGKR
jgi:integrase